MDADGIPWYTKPELTIALFETIFEVKTRVDRAAAEAENERILSARKNRAQRREKRGRKRLFSYENDENSDDGYSNEVDEVVAQSTKYTMEMWEICCKVLIDRFKDKGRIYNNFSQVISALKCRARANELQDVYQIRQSAIKLPGARVDPSGSVIISESAKPTLTGGQMRKDGSMFPGTSEILEKALAGPGPFDSDLEVYLQRLTLILDVVKDEDWWGLGGIICDEAVKNSRVSEEAMVEMRRKADREERRKQKALDEAQYLIPSHYFSSFETCSTKRALDAPITPPRSHKKKRT